MRTGTYGAPAEAEIQARYHRDVFEALYRWDEVWPAVLEIAGDVDNGLALGLDQLGHFGPVGTRLVADRLWSSIQGSLSYVIELGSGLGGVSRHLARVLRSRGASPCLIGVELVPDHCRVAVAIARSLTDTSTAVVAADARCLPVRSMSVDAVVATGSASHFCSMARVLVEARRVLRPGGVLVMTEEVGLRPVGAPPVGDDFAHFHPPEVFPPDTPERRRAQFVAAGFVIEEFEPLTGWALALLQQRVEALGFFAKCAVQVFGGDAAVRRLTDTLRTAAAEYQRGSIEPALIVARAPAGGVSEGP